MICPHCNAVNRDGAKFCDECGTRLQDQANIPATDVSDASADTEETPASGADIEALSGDNADSQLVSALSSGDDARGSSFDAHDDDVDHASLLDEMKRDLPEIPSIPLPGFLASRSDDEVASESESEDDAQLAPSDDGDLAESDPEASCSPADEDKHSEESDALSQTRPDETAVIDSVAPVSEASKTRRIDLSGIDTFAPEGTYPAPSSSWRDGGTMRLPRIEEQSSINDQKSFRAPDKDKKPRKGLKIALCVVLALCLCGGVAAFATYQMELWGGKVVPDVVGMTQADATNTLESKGFSVRATQVKSDETEGIVLLMDPSQGSRTAEGGEVVIHISTSRSIPSIVGVQKSDAEAALAAEGFNNVTYTTERSDEEEGTVLSVDPAEGEKARANTAITVTVAEPYTVPSVANMSQDQAAQALKDAGYTSHIQYVYNEEIAEGTVLGTEPGEGEKVPSGSDIAINVALSRATELVSATQYVLASGNTVTIDGVSYDIVSCDSVAYQGNETTAYSITATPFTYFLGVKLPLEARSVTGTITWNADNSIASGSPSISVG